MPLKDLADRIGDSFGPALDALAEAQSNVRDSATQKEIVIYSHIKKEKFSRHLSPLLASGLDNDYK